MGRVSKKSSFKSKKEARDPRQDHLDQLHMEFRKMEGKKKTSNEATQNNLRMQRQQIDKLRVDNDRLREDLEIETRQARATNAMSASSKLDRLKDEADEFSRKIAMEKKRKAELHAKTYTWMVSSRLGSSTSTFIEPKAVHPGGRQLNSSLCIRLSMLQNSSVNFHSSVFTRSCQQVKWAGELHGGRNLTVWRDGT
ncbi:hypothetical protein AAMO2058_000817600 [Amorphochlora amoebiformis]